MSKPSRKSSSQPPPLKTVDELAEFAFAEIAKSIQVKSDPERDAPDIIDWILGNKILTERGSRRPFEFTQHHFMVEPLRDWTPEQVVRKGSQIGFSTSMSLKEIYAALYRDHSSIHTFPTLSMVKKFVPVKVDGLIDVNPYLRGEVGRGTGNSQVKKKFGNSWVFWAGCEGDNEGIMDTADIIAFDEVDKAKPMTTEDFRSRLDASDYKGTWYFSNPTTDGAIISRRWKESDQKVWVHKCSRCGKHFVNNFYDCIDERRMTYVCRVCHRPLREEDRCHNPDTGYPRWVAKYPGREVSGYWINHMMAPWKSARDVIRDYQQQSDEYFSTFVLAKPVADAEARIKREQILRNCTAENPERGGLVLAGIDQGKSGGGGTHYMVIGNPAGIYALETAGSWADLDDLMDAYRVNMCVLDYLPDTDAAREFAARHPGKVLFNYQNKQEKSDDIFRFDEGEGFCYTDRNGMISRVVKAFNRGEIRIFLSPDDIRLVGQSQTDYKSYCAQAETLYRTEERTKDGNLRLVWQSTNGQDHWFLTTCYWYAAREHMVTETVEDEDSVQRIDPERAGPSPDDDIDDLLGVGEFDPSDAWLYV